MSKNFEFDIYKRIMKKKKAHLFLIYVNRTFEEACNIINKFQIIKKNISF